jgi:predicted neuraminidase
MKFIFTPAFFIILWSGVGVFAASPPGLVKTEFVFESAPFPSCHASTIVQTKKGTLIAAWFGGTAERNRDVGIWLARKVDDRWSAPVEVATGVQADGTRYPCWNPVLFQPSVGDLMLFYKVGPGIGSGPDGWRGMLRTSSNDGETWSDAKRLPGKFQGPIKNKPIELADGSILCGSSDEDLSPPPSWQIHFERTVDHGKTWQYIDVPQPESGPPAIQPSILRLGGDRLIAVGRTRSKKIFSTTSNDLGRTWSELKLLDLPNPNSGTDASTLRDGRHLLVYNHSTQGRTPLNLAESTDGEHWNAALVLESAPGEYSYPAIIQTSDGFVHITYTWNRKRIKHAVIDPDKLELRPIRDGVWPR